jgi:hypothetical protein
VVSTVQGARLVVVINTVGMRHADSRAGVGSVVAGANVMSRDSKTTSSNRGSGNFGVLETAVALVALPELHARALGVAVGWAGAVALLLLVVLGHEELEGDGDQEKEASEKLVRGGNVGSRRKTYAPTMETAKQAVLSLQMDPSEAE